MKYKILSQGSRVALVNEVEEYIEQGWEPLGGVSVVGYQGVQYFQAMIKR